MKKACKTNIEEAKKAAQAKRAHSAYSKTFRHKDRQLTEARADLEKTRHAYEKAKTNYEKIIGEWFETWRKEFKLKI